MVKQNARSPSITSQESYKSVMITDIVADVPVMTETQTENVVSRKENTNLAYDGQLDGDVSSPAELGKSESNGSGGLSKGIILNAVSFGQADEKCKINEKVTLPKKEEERTFKDMSLTRKILFGFSFLPSILFVLCFAVILPCNIPVKDPCVTEMWTTTFNNTGVTSVIQISENIILTLNERNQHIMITLNKINGSIINKETIFSKPIYLQCNNGSKCAIVDEEKRLYIFDTQNGTMEWIRFFNKDAEFFFTTSDTDCNSASESAIFVGTTSGKIELISHENTLSSVSITNCDSVPEKITELITETSNDLIFFCKSFGRDTLMKLPKEAWCDGEVIERNGTVIFTRISDTKSDEDYLLKTVEDGLILWLENEVMMFNNDGSLRWNVSYPAETSKNRFILNGKFTSKNMEIALVHSNIFSDLQINVLSAGTGGIVGNKTFSKYGATEGQTIHGKERDFVLLLLQKAKENVKHHPQLTDISSTVMSLISNEVGSFLHFENETLQEIVLMDMSTSFSPHKLKQKDEAFKTTLSADYDQKEDTLNVYLATSLKSSNMVEIEKLKIANWDITEPKVYTCSAS